jgi:hypothetical protein
MTPQASQTIPEKPGGRVCENENQVDGQRASNGKSRLQELQEFRSCRMKCLPFRGSGTALNNLKYHFGHKVYSTPDS